MLSTTERNLLESCLAVLRPLPDLKVRFSEETAREGCQGELSLQGPWGGCHFQVRLLPRLTPEGLQLLQLQRPRISGPLIVLCHHIGRRQAQTLKDLNQPFLDSSGNVWLQHPPLYLDIAGRRPQAAPQRPGRAFTPAGLKLIYLLLQDPLKARANFRQLATEAGIALGAVSGIFRELKNQNYLEQKGTRRRDLVRPEALLYRWQLGYLEQLRPRLLLERCRPASDRPLSVLARDLLMLGLGQRVLVGGEMGASLLAADGKANQLTLHLPKSDALRLMLQLQLTPDPAGPITLLQSFGTHNGWRGWNPEVAPLADPLLLYCELAAQQEGNSPLAETLLQKQILPRLEG